MAAQYDKAIAALADAGVEFLLIGGVAANLHGAARLTYDIDFLYRRNTANYERMVAALAPHQPYLRGAPPGLPFHWDVATIRNGLNFTLTTGLGDIDLLGDAAGFGYDQLVAGAVTRKASGRDVFVVSLPQLIQLKRAAGRPKDFEAIAELQSLLEEQERQGGSTA